MPKLVPWHKMHGDDIGLRLIHDGGYWIDLYQCNKKGYGEKLICSFNIVRGYALKLDATLDGESDIYTNVSDKPVIPYFKIWHNKQKAKCRLRLFPSYSGITVNAVDKYGKKIDGGYLLNITYNKEHVHLYRPLCINAAIDIPKTTYGSIYMEV